MQRKAPSLIFFELRFEFFEKIYTAAVLCFLLRALVVSSESFVFTETSDSLFV